MDGILAAGDLHPAEIVNAGGTSAIVLICEHASNIVPSRLKSLGLSASDLDRHIAYDIGALPVAVGLSRLLDAPLIVQRYSRLVYDCNRPPEADSAMPELSEIFEVPGNRNLTPSARAARTLEIYRPYMDAISSFLDARAARRQRAIPVSIHSFTKVYKGKDRAVELGLLFDRDDWLAKQLLKSFIGVNTQLNEPYGPKDGVMHLMNVHAAPRGLRHLMVEVRNDLISTERGQQEWAQRLSVPLVQAANTKEL